jgi:hypothetical protein
MLEHATRVSPVAYAPAGLKQARLASAFTWRSLTLGTLAVIAVCALTPYNDYALSDTSLVSGYLPLAAVLIEFLLVVAINAPLHRFAPRLALSTGELAVILMMTLVSCAIPNWGLMRFFIPTPVAPFHVGVSDYQYWNAFINLKLPAWLFPVTNVADGRNDPIAQYFFTGVPSGEPIPYRAWIGPLLRWGIFVAAMLTTLAALARLVLDQWMTNERLPFPLVQVQAALIEAPPAGRALNDLFRSPVLWIGLGTVMFIHMLSCLNTYFPQHVPKIPLGYDFTGILGAQPISGEPLSYLQTKVKKATISFIIIGVTYFIRSKVAFSLWGFFLIVNAVEIQRGMMGGDVPSAAWQDQHLGACVAFIAGLLWIGREHWLRVLRNAFGLGTSGTYRLSFWIAILGSVVMVTWLRVVGVQVWMAMLIVAFILLAHLIVSRVLAETGLPFFRTSVSVTQVYSNLPIGWFSGRDIFFSGVFSVLGPLTTRDGLMGFAMHGQGIAKQAGADETRTQRRWMGAAIGWTLLIGCIAAAWSTLYCQYTYPTPGTVDATPARNFFGAEYIPKRDVGNAFTDFSSGHFTAKPHRPFVHMTIGFVVTGFLEFAALRWQAWPLLPVGYITSYGAFIGNAWFSIFVGWIAKVLIVRFGGAQYFQRARPLFVGMIFGEALAAGIWLIINAIVVLNGGTTQSVKFLF